MKHRVAVVTGAASGIGEACCRLLAERGASVVLMDVQHRQGDRLARELQRPAEHLAIRVDVADPDSVAAGFDVVARRYGTIDVAILGAGIWRAGSDGPLAEVALDTWTEVVGVNLTGVFLTAQRALPLLRDDAGAAIVTIASVTALEGWPDTYAYSASKGGVVALTRVLAAEVAPRGIRANCICPGSVDTPMVRDALERSQPRNLAGRPGTPAEVAEAALYLCSEAAAFVTGTVLRVDGGAVAP